MKEKLGFATRAIKHTEYDLAQSQPVSAPIYLSTTYVRNPDGSYNHDFIYSRNTNPNRLILERAIANLENGAHCFTFASGMAAIHAIFQSLETGQHIILPDDVYYNIYALVKGVFQRWGLSFTLVDMTDLIALDAAIQENTALIWVETPSNPQLKVSDIPAIVSIAKKYNVQVAVDNTWPSPVLQRPLELGADIVMHSTTKYFGGHSDVLSGAVILNDNNPLTERIQQVQILSGGVPSPFDCWLVSRGIQTLHVRVMAQTKSAQQLAEFLAAHPAIERVNYPGLADNPYHQTAAAQMPNGFGAMLSVLLKGDAQKAIEVSNRLQLFTTATSLGGVESLVEHRKSVEGPESPTPDNLLRLSVGLENVEDLINDWKQALEG